MVLKKNNDCPIDIIQEKIGENICMERALLGFPPYSLLFTGLSGFFPIHPRSYMQAWRNRAMEREQLAKQAEAEAKETSS